LTVAHVNLAHDTALTMLHSLALSAFCQSALLMRS
jgi:hypothetical protein